MTTKHLPTPNTTYATPAVAAILEPYFEAKTGQDVEGLMSFYAKERTSHNDAVIGWTNIGWEALRDLFAQYMPTFGDGRSYATQVLGDENSAVVFVTNEAAVFGGDMRGISAVDFQDGKITRFVDYWDARHFGTRAANGMAVPAGEFPRTFGEDGLPDRAAPRMRETVDALTGALAAADADRAAALFADDAVLDDFALRIRVRAKPAITRYLGRAIDTLPYGPEATVRRVLGDGRGGGYEWVNPAGPIPRGITALGLDEDGLIEQLSVVYDAALLDDDELAAAMGRVPDPREE